MVETGLTWVRIGEFAWSRLEPTPGHLDFDWLDRAIAALGSAGLKIVLGTPTATPPRWMITKHPDMLATDKEGRPRKFGSRRHYCFSHSGYRDECRRIVTLLGERFGDNQHVAAWQIDNEYGCHDTAISYSNAARDAFRNWCAQRYQSPDALNQALAGHEFDTDGFLNVRFPIRIGEHMQLNDGVAGFWVEQGQDYAVSYRVPNKETLRAAAIEAIVGKHPGSVDGWCMGTVASKKPGEAPNIYQEIFSNEGWSAGVTPRRRREQH